MTLAEKIGQMTQAERLGLQSPAQIADARPRLGAVRRRLGAGRRTPPTGWADMIDGFQRQALSTRLQIPLIYGVDAVHGHNNVVGRDDLPAQHRAGRRA